MKSIVLKQYQDIVNQASLKGSGITLPKEGWLRTLRKSLGMSGAQLARKLGVTRAQVAKSEKNELAEVITLKTLQNMAHAMGGRVVYTIVLPSEVEKMVKERAREKARGIIEKANTQMALESQTLDNKTMNFELDRLEQEILKEMPTDFWDDE